MRRRLIPKQKFKFIRRPHQELKYKDEYNIDNLANDAMKPASNSSTVSQELKDPTTLLHSSSTSPSSSSSTTTTTTSTLTAHTTSTSASVLSTVSTATSPVLPSSLTGATDGIQDSEDIIPDIQRCSDTVLYIGNPSQFNLSTGESNNTSSAHSDSTCAYSYHPGVLQKENELPTFLKKFAFILEGDPTSISSPSNANHNTSTSSNESDNKGKSSNSQEDDATTQHPLNNDYTFELGPDISEGSDIWLSQISSCYISICQRLGAVRLSKLRNSIIIIGPTAGSVYIESAEQCIIVVACRQLRIHEATHVDFYVSTESKPIIEHSHHVKFAPFSCVYPLLNQHLKDAKLTSAIQLIHLTQVTNVSSTITKEASSISSTAMSNNSSSNALNNTTGSTSLSGDDEEERKLPWANVDDFNWLRQTKSPNWSIVPRSQRRGPFVPVIVKESL